MTRRVVYVIHLLVFMGGKIRVLSRTTFDKRELDNGRVVRGVGPLEFGVWPATYQCEKTSCMDDNPGFETGGKFPSATKVYFQGSLRCRSGTLSPIVSDAGRVPERSWN